MAERSRKQAHKPEARAEQAAPSPVPAPQPPAPAKQSRASKFIPLLILVVVIVLGQQVLKLRKTQKQADLTFTYLGKAGQRGSGTGFVMGSYAMASDDKDNFFVLDDLGPGEGGSTRIQKFSAEGKLLKVYTPKNLKEAILEGRQLAVDSKGRLYVGQTRGGLVVLSNDLGFINRWDTTAVARQGVAIDPDDKVVRIEPDSNSILWLDAKDGKTLSKVALKGESVASSSQVVVLADGRMVLLGGDDGTPTVRVLSKEGSMVKKFTIKGLGYSQFCNVGVDPGGRVYINDSMGDKGIRVYGLSGKLIGGAKSTNTNLDFPNCGGMYVSQKTGTIYVNTALGIDKMAYPAQP